MHRWHPLMGLAQGPWRWPVFVALSALTFVMSARTKQGLVVKPTVPLGIINLELPGTATRAKEIIAVWKEDPEEKRMEGAWKHLKADAWYIPCYATLIGFACLMAGPSWGRVFSWGGAASVGLAWALWGAGALDYCENAGIAQMLRGNFASPVPQVTTACALVKWALTVIGVLFALVGAALWFSHRSA